MSVKLPQLFATDPRAALNRALTRKIDRRPITGAVQVLSNTGDSAAAGLRDISAHGCNFSSSAEWLRTGRFVAIRLGKDRTVQAIVRWSRDGLHGVEFLRPISDAEAEAISGLL